MNKRIRGIAIALIVGVVLYLLGVQYLPNLGVNAAPSTVDIIVASTDIAALQPITASVLHWKTVSLDTYQALGPSPATLADRDRVIGAVARVPIMAGQPVLLGELSGPNLPSDRQVQPLPPDYGLYAIQAPYLSTPTFGLGPGTWVDVTATYQARPGKMVMGPTGTLTSSDDMQSSTLAETTLETHVEVTDVRLTPQPAVTIAIPRRDVRIFDYFKRIATFSFSEVSPNARHVSFPSLTSSQIKEMFGVSSR